MKKIVALIIFIIIIVTFAGCAAPQNKISYSYRFGYETEHEDKLLESYTYTVKAEQLNADNTLNPPFYIKGNGTYTVNIYKEEPYFKIVTDFSFTGRYHFTADNSESEEFTDTIHSESFATISFDNFTPVSAQKSFVTSLPVFEEGKSSKKAYYSYNIDYQKVNNDIKIISAVKDEETDDQDRILITDETNADVKLTTGGRLVDNEHIFLAVRLQTIDSKFTDSFNVFDSLYGVTQKLSVTTKENFEEREFDGKTYECYVLAASISGKNKGSDTLMYFARSYYYDYINNGKLEENININLLIEFKHGNLIYTLSEYNNYAKGQKHAD